tara:strand:+ start:2832 stop:3143 length:312 start_codon:yes stop_codon:yes gene_type:complete
MLQYDDYLGISGSFFLIVAYFCTTYKIFNKPYIIDLFNLYGSGTVGFNCLIKHAYSPFFLEVVWFIIALISLFNNICHMVAEKTNERINMRNQIANNANYNTL